MLSRRCEVSMQMRAACCVQVKVVCSTSVLLYADIADISLFGRPSAPGACLPSSHFSAFLPLHHATATAQPGEDACPSACRGRDEAGAGGQHEARHEDAEEVASASREGL